MAPPDVIARLVQLKQSADLHTSTFAQMVMYEVAKDGFIDEHVKTIRQCYKERRDAMLSALDDFFPPEVKWTHPQGGLFLWVTLPDGRRLYAAVRRSRAPQRGVRSRAPVLRGGRRRFAHASELLECDARDDSRGYSSLVDRGGARGGAHGSRRTGRGCVDRRGAALAAPEKSLILSSRGGLASEGSVFQLFLSPASPQNRVLVASGPRGAADLS